MSQDLDSQLPDDVIDHNVRNATPRNTPQHQLNATRSDGGLVLVLLGAVVGKGELQSGLHGVVFLLSCWIDSCIFMCLTVSVEHGGATGELGLLISFMRCWAVSVHNI